MINYHTSWNHTKENRVQGPIYCTALVLKLFRLTTQRCFCAADNVYIMDYVTKIQSILDHPIKDILQTNLCWRLKGKQEEIRITITEVKKKIIPLAINPRDNPSISAVDTEQAHGHCTLGKTSTNQNGK